MLRIGNMLLQDPPGNDHISHQTGKGKSSTQKCRLVGAMLVPWRLLIKVPYNLLLIMLRGCIHLIPATKNQSRSSKQRALLSQSGHSLSSDVSKNASSYPISRVFRVPGKPIKYFRPFIGAPISPPVMGPIL